MTQMIEEVYLHNRGRYYVKELHDVKLIENEYWLECSWRGLETEEKTWERYDDLKVEIPQLVHDFLLSIRDDNHIAQLLLKDFINN